MTAQVPGYSETPSSDLAESIANSVKQGAAFIVHSFERTNDALSFVYLNK